jgi:hypothetical protein
MSGSRGIALALATMASLVLALGLATPASADQVGPPGDCGFDHGCSYRDSHYGVKIWSPSSLGGVCSNDFPDSVNDELSSVYNHATGNDYWLFEHNNRGGQAAGFANNIFLAHLSVISFNDEASSCAWF